MIKRRLAITTGIGILIALSPVLSANAATIDSQNKSLGYHGHEIKTVKGHVGMDIAMSRDEATYMKNLMEKLVQRQDPSNPQSERDINSHHRNIESLFHASHDGKTNDLIDPLPFVTVQVDGQTVNTDAQGNFFISMLSKGTYTVTVSQHGAILDRATVDIKNNGRKPIDLTISHTLQGLYQNMMNHMNMSSSNTSSTHTMNMGDAMTKPQLSPSLTATNCPLGPYYPGQVVGQGQGKMKILDTQNHVSCNKSSGDCGANFPFNNSDCAQSIGAGFVYENDPLAFFFESEYYDGTFCVDEGMAWAVNLSGDNESNIYCNDQPNTGQKPSNDWYHGFTNQGFNCSSFPFLKHDERLNWISGS